MIKAYPQQNYSRILSSPDHQFCSNAVETSNNEMIFFANYTQKSNGGELTYNSCYALLVKVNASGDSVASRIFMEGGDFTYYSRILKVENNEFIAIGTGCNVLMPNPFVNYKVLYTRFNENLEIMEQKSIMYYEQTNTFSSDPRVIINNENQIIVVEQRKNQYPYVTCFKLTIDGDSIASYSLLPPSYSIFGDIVQKPDYTGYYLTFDGEWDIYEPYSESTIIEVDNDFNYISKDSLPANIGSHNQIRQFNSSTYITGGQAFRVFTPSISPPMPWITQEYCIEKLGLDLKATKQAFLCPLDKIEDTIYSAANLQNFDFIDTNNIYSVYVREYLVIFPAVYNYLVIARLNSNLDVKWQYFYGFEAYYHPYAIYATSDGGCFFIGQRYD